MKNKKNSRPPTDDDDDDDHSRPPTKEKQESKQKSKEKQKDNSVCGSYLIVVGLFLFFNLILLLILLNPDSSRVKSATYAKMKPEIPKVCFDELVLYTAINPKYPKVCLDAVASSKEQLDAIQDAEEFEKMLQEERKKVVRQRNANPSNNGETLTLLRGEETAKPINFEKELLEEFVAKRKAMKRRHCEDEVELGRQFDDILYGSIG